MHGISFHDATVNAVAADGNTLILSLTLSADGDALDPLATGSDGTLTFSGVTEILADGSEVRMLTMEGESGEVLRLEQTSPGRTELFIIWTSFEPLRSQNRFYEISCAGMTWTSAEA